VTPTDPLTMPFDATRSVWIVLGLAVAASASALAWAPLLGFGAIIGLTVLAATVRWPLAVVAVMLTLGPLDLSGLTGGFKGLFEHVGGLDMNGIRLLSVTLGLALVVLADRRSWGRVMSWPVAAYLVFLAYVGVTLAVSMDPLEGLRLWFKLLWPLLIFLVVSGPDRSVTDVQRLTTWILIGAVVLLVTSPLYVFSGDIVVEATGERRLQGAGTHQNPYSFYLLVVVLLSMGRFVTRRHFSYLLLALTALVSIGLTQTRITLVAGVLAFGLVSLYWVVVRRDWRAGGIGLLLVAVIVGTMAPTMLIRTFGQIPTAGYVASLVNDPIAAYSAINWNGREFIWAALVAAWMTSPLIGLGLGSSTAILKGTFHKDVGLVAHNEYIRLGTDTGFIGIGLMLVVGLSWLMVAATVVSRKSDEAYEIALPALAVLVAIAVISLTDNAIDYYTPLTQFAGFLIAGCVLVRRADTR